jgi:hypothetical protein
MITRASHRITRAPPSCLSGGYLQHVADIVTLTLTLTLTLTHRYNLKLTEYQKTLFTKKAWPKPYPDIGENCQGCYHLEEYERIFGSADCTNRLAAGAPGPGLWRPTEVRCAFLPEFYTRGCHWFPRACSLEALACV